MAVCPKCQSPFDEGDACPNCATQIFDSPRSPFEAPQISGYEIVSRLGEGGMGAIYLADEKSLGRRVAIKVISGKLATDTQARARFTREARTLATVEHANVVRIYAFGEVEGQPYLAMEYIEGQTLADKIGAEGRLPIDESLRLMRQVLLALDAAWEKGIVHRDIKPSNVLLDRRGVVHVADFGLAKPTQVAEDATLTQAGSVIGTPYYVSPEQAQGLPADFRSDIYACGILLYEMLAGERPFEGTTPLSIVAKHLNTPLPSVREKRRDVPGRVARLIEQMTEKQAAKRPQSYAELITTLDAILGITPSGPITATQTVSPAMPTPRRRYATLLVLCLPVLLTIAASTFLYLRAQRNRAVVSTAAPDTSRLTVAVAPFYGPDEDSAKEGRVMAALIERSIIARLGANNVTVAGIEETKQPLRSHDAARELGKRLGASVVVWGEAFALKRETELQPYFTMVQPDKAASSGRALESRLSTVEKSIATAAPDALASASGADDLDRLAEQRSSALRVESEAPNEIELRKTSAEGVGEMVSFLAAVHALYEEHAPEKALDFLDRAPRTVESLKVRARALLNLAAEEDAKEDDAANNRAESHRGAAATALEELVRLDPAQTQSRADLADLYLVQGRRSEAVSQYQRVIASTEPYTTHFGVINNGQLYVREILRRYNGNPRFWDTGYLLAVSPEGIATGRWRMPGMIRSFTPTATGLAIDCVDRVSGQMCRVDFVKGSPNRPTLPGGDFMLRMHAMKSAWMLPENFMSEFSGLIDQQKPRPRFRASGEIMPEAPATLPDLEVALREATRRDPTQPWHLFFLGHTLLAEGKKDDAAAVFDRLLTGEFGVLYADYNWMAKLAERLGQDALADRLAARGTRERARIAQPVGITSLLERIMNVNYNRLHAEDRKDPERAYTWWILARKNSGPTEADHYAAAAWKGHFRRLGDSARAATEQKFYRRAAALPINLWPPLIDYSMYATLATLFGLIAGTALLLSRAAAASARDETWVHPARLADISLRHEAVVALVLLLIVVAATCLAWLPLGDAPLLVAALTLLLLLAIPRRQRLRNIIAAINRRERIAIAVVVVMFAGSSLLLFNSMERYQSLLSMPLGLADSLGHPVMVAQLEKDLGDHPNDAMRYLAGVANEAAGNLDRAKALYALTSDSRAKKSLDALNQGRSAISYPTIEDVFAAYAPKRLAWTMPRPWVFVGDTPVEKIVNRVLAIVAGATVALLICFVLIPVSGRESAIPTPRNLLLRVVAKCLFILTPGAYDMRRGSVARGLSMLSLTAFAILFTVSMHKVSSWHPGLWTATFLPDFSALPMPPDLSTLDLMLAPPGARWFWAFVVVALAYLLVAHIARIPAILRLYRDDVHDERTLVTPAPVA